MTHEAQAFVGIDQRTAVLRLTGNPRYLLAPSVESAIWALLRAPEVDTALIDLRTAESVDSTILGLIARLGSATLEACGRRAVIAVTHDDIRLSLAAAGFDEVFEVVARPPFEPQGLAEIDPEAPGRVELGRAMLEAHEALVEMGGRTEREYRESVELLRRQLAAERSRGA